MRTALFWFVMQRVVVLHADVSCVCTQPWNISTRLSNVLYVGYVLVEYDAESATFRNREMPFVSKGLDVRQECHIFSQPLSLPTSQSVSQSVNQPVVQSASQSVSQEVNQPVVQTASQSVSQSINQSFKQSASQPVNQPVVQLAS
jgi:hypothetical protein